MKLTLVGLPLGNIEDISLRAIKTLANAKMIICEDTRVFLKLWQKLVNLGFLKNKYAGKFFVLNEYNEKSKVSQCLLELELIGEGILVTDAGLPTISDPGYVLVKTVIDAGGEIDLITGPTAAMSALAISGFSSDRVLYLGFLPKKTSKRNKIWSSLTSRTDPEVHQTIIIYESPLRVAKTLVEIKHSLGDIPCVIARELTKEHQQVIRGNISEVLSQIGDKPLKGEIVLLFRY